MTPISQTDVLAQMRRLAAQAGGDIGSSGLNPAAHATAKAEFDNAFKSALDKVNEAQQISKQTKTAFEKGDPNVTLIDTVLAGQKAGLAFEATVQVRNRLVQAYQDIMNMPI